MALEATDWMCEDDRIERPGLGVAGHSAPSKWWPRVEESLVQTVRQRGGIR